MSIDTLLTLVELYKEAAQLIEAAQTEQETLKAQIKEALAQRATDYLEVGCHKIRLSDFSSTRLDSKSIKTVAPDLYAQYSKTVTGQRLTINEEKPHTAPTDQSLRCTEPYTPAGAGCTFSIPVPAFFIKRKVVHHEKHH